MNTISRFFMCVTVMLSSVATATQEGPYPFALITIPKSGSHMIIKALYSLTGGTPVWHTNFPSAYCIPPEEGFLYTHLCLSPQLEKNYADLRRLRKIINIRDLRDVCVSIVRQICKSPWPGMTQEERVVFKKMSFHDQLLFVINFDYDVEEVAEFAPDSLQTSVIKVAEQAVRYSSNPNFLVCKYEDLVGEEGGGSREVQKEALERVAGYLGLDVSESSIEEIARCLYGNEVDPFGQNELAHFRSTFYKGKIGAWKNFFTEEHKRVFKEKLGKALIALGYEQDDNW